MLDWGGHLRNTVYISSKDFRYDLKNVIVHFINMFDLPLKIKIFMIKETYNNNYELYCSRASQRIICLTAKDVHLLIMYA